jgi:hypothetical protein
MYIFNAFFNTKTGSGQTQGKLKKGPFFLSKFFLSMQTKKGGKEGTEREGGSSAA